MQTYIHTYQHASHQNKKGNLNCDYQQTSSPGQNMRPRIKNSHAKLQFNELTQLPIFTVLSLFIFFLSLTEYHKNMIVLLHTSNISVLKLTQD